MRDVVIAGVGMTRFGKWPDLSLNDLARIAIWEAIDDAGVDPRSLGIAYLGNSYAGILQGQESGRAVTILRNAGLGGMAMVHVECGTTSSTLALQAAWHAVGSDEYEAALAVGVEKIYIPDNPARSIAAISTSGERLVSQDMGLTPLAGVWLDLLPIMEKYDWTLSDVARVAAKNHRLGTLNPRGESQRELSVDEILEDRKVLGPLTRSMCASAAIDGAAAAIVCSEAFARRLAAKQIRIAACSSVGGRWLDESESEQLPGLLSMTNASEAFARAYARAGIGATDLDLLEVHEAVAAEELVAYEAVGLCPPGEGNRLIREGDTDLGGRCPCNVDGGLIGRGHPIGATGLAQICETVWQLRGEAGDRQIRHGDRLPRVGAIQNAGGSAMSGGPSVGAQMAVILVN